MGYIRVSTNDHAEDGFGLDIQRDAIRQWAKSTVDTASSNSWRMRACPKPSTLIADIWVGRWNCLRPGGQRPWWSIGWIVNAVETEFVGVVVKALWRGMETQRNSVLPATHRPPI